MLGGRYPCSTGQTMIQAVLTQKTDFYRLDANRKLDPKRRSILGQFMTPAPIARFMASLFSNTCLREIRILDCGAGVGSLTSAFVDEFSSRAIKAGRIKSVSYEIEPIMLDYLTTTLGECSKQCLNARIRFDAEVRNVDFIESAAAALQADLFTGSEEPASFTHAILNPPYKKIATASLHRKLMRAIGIEASNLYTAFLALVVKLLKPSGEFVAIVPRSFCNGPYFRLFREFFLEEISIRHIHVFESRSTAFGDDDVLQENIIVHGVKVAERTAITVTTSSTGDFGYEPEAGTWIGSDFTSRDVPYECIVKPQDQEQFIHIAPSGLEQRIVDRISEFQIRLPELGIEVSTGPVVDFRLKADLRKNPTNDSVPLLYPVHFQNSRLEWPKASKKPNAIKVSEASRKWLWVNEGYFVVTRRFTAKEEKRRIAATIYDGSLHGELVGFENHLNVFHSNQQGIDKELGTGLAIYLNSSLVDRYFRQFNGHTQVNATDLRNIRYPEAAVLKRLGVAAGSNILSQVEIDQLLEKEITEMSEANTPDPLHIQRRIDEALDVIKALGMPREQHNERSALTLLALLELKPDDSWNDSTRPLMGITPIMDFCRDIYGKSYAPNTRETFRRQTMHQFVDAGIAVYNPDKSDRPVNSPKACYQISEAVYEVVRNLGAEEWNAALSSFLKQRKTLAQQYAKERNMEKIPVQISGRKKLELTPGIHSKLIKDIIEEFATRFTPGSEIIYVGDTGEKAGHFESDKLAELGVVVDKHGKMPDVVLFYSAKNWLLLVESVTSHGPVDAKRHGELATLFAFANPELVYVTAFPDRQTMGKHLGAISWETEVWVADSPTHLIHFDGERFLGPHNKTG
ncbi:MAG: Type-2 restriction enzyme AplI [Verrucomicrobia subdivision 3 bacterium]|nr:Type-2 restriction enzyme AplI [Limisphaerales bacterium]MCS1417693.1 Type-2 restriction enzyme AplI [Limisphaerales bacterium]